MNYGYVKIKTHGHDQGQLYVDGGYADIIRKSKTFAMRPGTHDIELRDSFGHKLLQERVAVLIGKTTKVDIPS